MYFTGPSAKRNVWLKTPTQQWKDRCFPQCLHETLETATQDFEQLTKTTHPEQGFSCSQYIYIATSKSFKHILIIFNYSNTLSKWCHAAVRCGIATGRNDTLQGSWCFRVQVSFAKKSPEVKSQDYGQTFFDEHVQCISMF